MTYVLHHTSHFTRSTQTHFADMSRFAAHVLGLAKRAALRSVAKLAHAPDAIGRAFASAYVDPYQPKGSGRNPSDPENF